VLLGVISLVFSEALTSGRRARRKMMMSIASRNRRIGSVIHPTRLKNSAAMGEVLSHLNPQRVIAHLLRDADAGNGRLALTRLHEREIGGAGIAGEHGGVVLQRGEQDAPSRIEDGVGISPVGLRIEILKRRRQIEHRLVLAAHRQMPREQIRLVAHRLLMQVIGSRFQEPVEHQRHEDRGNHHCDHMQEYDSGKDRFERDHASFSSAMM